MNGIVENGMIVIAGVVVVLGFISMYFVSSHLKKVDDIPAIKEQLKNLVEGVEHLNQNFTKLIDKYIDLEKRVTMLEYQIRELEK
jgi:sensor histidine kinase YesM